MLTIATRLSVMIAAILFVLIMLTGAAQADTCEVQLTDVLDVRGIAVTPDGEQVVYEVWSDDGDSYTVYSVPMIGGDSRPLATLPHRPLDRYPLRYAIYSDSLIYQQDDGLYRLFFAADEPQRLVDTPVTEFRLTPDQQYLVYSVQEVALYSLALTDPVSSPVPLGAVDNPRIRYQITPDGQTVIYFSADGVTGSPLYRVPVVGGDPVQLTNPDEHRPPNGWFFVTPDSQHVLYTGYFGYNPNAASETDEEYPLYSISLADATVTLLVDPLGFISHMPTASPIRVSPDGRYVVYVQGLQLLSQPIGGGDPVRLDGLDIVQEYPQVAITPDGSRVIYQRRAWGDDLYAVPITGGDPVEIAQATGNRSIAFFTLSPEALIYAAVHDDLSITFDLGSAPLDGGETTMLVTDGELMDYNGMYYLTPDGQSVLFSNDADDPVAPNTPYPLFLIPVHGGQPARITDGFRPYLPLGRAIAITPDSRYVVYRADGSDGQHIYSTDLACLAGQ